MEQKGDDKRALRNARKNVVVHTDYQFGSILRFFEKALNLPPLSSLGYGSIFTDSTSNSLDDSFDFSQNPESLSRSPQNTIHLTFCTVDSRTETYRCGFAA
jgi:hypothetical protein